LLDRTRCPGCGQPTWLAHDPKSNWRPSAIRCQSCNAIEDRKAAMGTDERALHNVQAIHFHTEHVP